MEGVVVCARIGESVTSEVPTGRNFFPYRVQRFPRSKDGSNPPSKLTSIIRALVQACVEQNPIAGVAVDLCEAQETHVLWNFPGR